MRQSLEPNWSHHWLFLRSHIAAIAIVAVFFGLYLVSLKNYLLFHSLAEIFSIVVACSVFMFAWNAREYINNNYILFLGIAYFFIGMLDLLHALAYRGMGVFKGDEANLPTQLWIAARYLQGLSLFIAPLLLNRQVRLGYVFAAYTAAFLLVMLAVFHWRIFPTCYVQGVGLTPFKKISEYLISLMLLMALILLIYKRKAFDLFVFKLLAASIIATIGSELAFTFYVEVYDFSNLTGHFLKIIAFILVYIAILQTGLTQPYGLLWKQLLVERDRAQQYLDVAGVMFVVLDRGGSVVQINRKGCKVLGYLQEEIVGKNWFDQFLPPTVRETVRAVFIQLMAGEVEPVEYVENAVLCHDGSERIIAWHNAVIRDGTQMIQFTLGSGEDITERKRAEEALKASETRLANAQQIAHLGTWEIDFRTDREIWSDETYCILGYEPHAFVPAKEHLVSQVHPQDRDRIRQAVARSIERKTPFDLEFRIIRPGCESRTLHVQGEIYVDEGGRPLKMLAAVQDITPQKIAAEQLQAAQKMKTIGQLTGGIAHDFNNLLAVIMGNLELLNEQLADNPELQELAHRAFTAADRGAILVQQLLAYARQQPLQARPVNVNTLVRDMVGFLQRTLGKDIQIDMMLAVGLGQALVDPVQFENALLNLAINARDAMPQGGRLTIETANCRLTENTAAFYRDVRSGEYILLTVSDTGVGMAPEVLEHAFEPFFTTKGPGKGSGLGLSMVYGLVKQSGGDVHIDSRVGQGTTVKLFLPKTSAAPVEEAEESAESARLGRGETILVVEDDAGVRQFAVNMLNNLGYRVVEADNADKALHILTETPEVVLLFADIVIPGGMSGIELALEARRGRPDLKVLFTSGYSSDAFINLDRFTKGAAFIPKPYRQAGLANQLHTLLQREVDNHDDSTCARQQD